MEFTYSRALSKCATCPSHELNGVAKKLEGEKEKMAARKKVITPVFRLSFPSIFEPAKPMEGSEGKKPKYEITMVFDPSKFSPEEKARFKEMEALANEASVEKFKKPLDKLPAGHRKPFRDGAEKEHLTGFGEGTVFAKASSFMKPGIVASDGKTPIEDAEAIYPGCYCRASVTAYSYTNVSKGVAFGLSNIMFVKDGERLDNRTDAAEDFGESAVSDDGL